MTKPVANANFIPNLVLVQKKKKKKEKTLIIGFQEMPFLPHGPCYDPRYTLREFILSSYLI